MNIVQVCLLRCHWRANADLFYATTTEFLFIVSLDKLKFLGCPEGKAACSFSPGPDRGGDIFFFINQSWVFPVEQPKPEKEQKPEEKPGLEKKPEVTSESELA